MKRRTFFSLAAVMIATTGFAQPAAVSSKYEKAVLDNLVVLDTASAPATFMVLANNFDRIAQVEKKEWIPLYYTAYTYTIMSLNTPDNSRKDLLADKAEGYLKMAEQLSPGNSEISCLHAMIISARILADPMNRWQNLSGEAAGHLSTAKSLDPANPRPFLLEANTKLRTPEAMGGGKKAAKPIVEDAIRRFDTFQPANTLSPNWGKRQALRLLQVVGE